MIDSPPIISVTDALTLLTVVYATILICSTNDTHLKAVEQARKALADVGMRMTGVILNRCDVMTANGGYGYVYSYAYE